MGFNMVAFVFPVGAQDANTEAAGDLNKRGTDTAPDALEQDRVRLVPAMSHRAT